MEQTCNSLLNLADTFVLGGYLSFMVFGYYAYSLTYRYLELRDNKNLTSSFTNLYNTPVPTTDFPLDNFSEEQNEPVIRKFIFVNSKYNSDDLESNEIDTDSDLSPTCTKNRKPAVKKCNKSTTTKYSSNNVESNETDTNNSPCSTSPCSNSPSYNSPRYMPTPSNSRQQNCNPNSKKCNKPTTKKCSGSTESFVAQMYVPDETDECNNIESPTNGVSNTPKTN